jgi:Fic family protein
MGRAIAGSQTILEGVLSKARFWETVAGLSLNERQKLVLQKLLDNFEGKLTTSKWSKMAKCSHDTALRDIQALVDRSVLVRRIEGGRSTSYELVKIA